MRWQQGRRSSNVDDRRARGGGGGALKLGGAGGLVVLVIAVGMVAMGKDPSALLDAMGGGSSGQSSAVPTTPESDRMADFATVVLGSTEDVWTPLFAARGATYRAPTLVLFRGAVASACGTNSSAVGPFYCPPDQQVYIDLSFFDELEQRFDAPGDFAQAYVLAHEVGHHVQNLLGISQRTQSQRARLGASDANALSVRVELQADCFAGVWAHQANARQQMLEAGDFEEGMNAASAIGDDALQRQSTGRVRPESWTHGSSAQRRTWLMRGFESGSIEACDTFASQ